MARINIESHLFSDARYITLMIKLGHRWMAQGALIEAWNLAHKFHSLENPNGLIPKKDWDKRECCNAIIEVGLAEIHGDFIYMCGAPNQFKGLLEHKRKGKLGGQKKEMNKKVAVKGMQHGATKTLAGLDPSKPSLAGSSSLSFSSTFTKNHHREPENADAARGDDDDDCCTTLRFGDGEVFEDEKAAAENSVTDLLSAMFSGPVPQDIRRAAPQMLAKFDGDPEAVKAHLKELWQNPKVRGEDEQITNRPGYLRVALINHFGLSEVAK